MELVEALLAEVQSFKNENMELKQKFEELTKSVNEINIKPTLTIDNQKLSNLIWQNIEPKLGNVSQSIKPQIDQFQKIVSKIPHEIKQTQIKEFKIFNGKWFALWGVIFFFLFLLSIFLIPIGKIKYSENAVENVYQENQILKEKIKNFTDKNPKLGEKYFNH